MEYTLQKLQEIEQQYNITLIYDKNKIKRETIVEGPCQTENCNNIFRKIFRALLKTGCNCKDCSKIKGYAKRKKTISDRYGVDNMMYLEETKEKIKKTVQERYNVDNVSECKEIREKYKKTMLKKYNVENPSQSEEIRERKKANNKAKYGVEHTLQVPEVREQIKKTNLALYGAECSLQGPAIQEKSRQTNLEKYNVEWSSQCEEIKEKNKQTNLLRYGFESPMQCEEVKEKGRQTNLARYGVEYAIQDPEIFQRAQTNSFKYKKYIAPNGEEFLYQGYERFALRDIFQQEEYLKEKNLVRTRNVPVGIYTFQEKTHKYFPDIYIERENLILEIKSKYIMALHKERNFLKQNAMKALGYLCEIWVYDAKGTRIEIYP